MTHVQIASAKINMEPHTNALEVVCRHFKQEYGTEALLKLRKETNCLASHNYSLRKQIENMDLRIRHLLEHSERIRITHHKLVVKIHHVKESLAVVSPYL